MGILLITNKESTAKIADEVYEIEGSSRRFTYTN